MSDAESLAPAPPAPMTPPDCDLRHLPYMPLHVARLRDSRSVDCVDGEAFRAAVLLWCAAWHQVPAASLPDDDLQLAKLAGFGRVVAEWRKLREEALRGFVKCSDGRLYHTVVAEIANTTWQETLELRQQRADERSRKLRERTLPRGPREETERRRHHRDPALPDDVPLSGGQDPSVLRKNDACPKDNVPLSGGNRSEEKRTEENRSEENRIESNPLSARDAAREGGQDVDAIAKEGQGDCTTLDARDIALDFEEFWSVYPPAANASKEKARAVFAKLVHGGAGPPPGVLIAAAKAYAAHVIATTAQRRPGDPLRISHPANWLAEKRYDAWLVSAAKTDSALPPLAPGERDIGDTPALHATRDAFIAQHGPAAWRFYLAPCVLIEVRQENEEQQQGQNPAQRTLVRLRAPTPFIATYARKTFGPTLRTLNIGLLPP